MDFGKAIKYDIIIKASGNNGFIVTAGCGTFVFSDKKSLLRALDDYISDPKGCEAAYNKICGATQAVWWGRRMITPVILAAGKGTRLWSVVSDRPKPLADINGRPFITYIFDQLIEAGFTSVVVCISYMAEKFFEILGRKYKSLDIIYSIENEPINPDQTLMSVTKLVLGTMLVMNGDTYVDIDLKKYIKEAMKAKGILSFVYNNKGVFAGIRLIKVENPKIHKYTAEFLDIGTPETYAKTKEVLGDNFKNTV